jgi:hypothetical protein
VEVGMRLWAGALFGLALLSGWAGPEASGRAQKLEQPAEARKWLDLLRRQGPLDGERLAVLTLDGQLLDSIDGGRSRISLPPRLGPLIGDPTRPVIFVHNHPGGNGLSADDVGMLSAPGLRQVIAVGHEGSLYKAATGSRSDVLHRPIPLPVFTLAKDALLAALDSERGRYDGHVMEENQAHMIALVLARTGVIDYQATLGRVRALGWKTNEHVFARTLDTAARRLSIRLAERQILPVAAARRGGRGWF